MRYEINYSHFYRGGLGDILNWCNRRAHKIKKKKKPTDFRPSLTYESTLADLWQQPLTSFYTVCDYIICLQKEKHCGVFRGEAVTRETNICSQSDECF